MKSLFDLTFAFILLICYCYALITAHINFARADRHTNIPRQPDGEISLREIRIVICSGTPIDAELKKAASYLKLSNYITYLFFGLLIYSLLFEASSS